MLDELGEIKKLFDSEQYQVEGFSGLEVTGQKVKVNCSVMLRSFIDVDEDSIEKLKKHCSKD